MTGLDRCSSNGSGGRRVGADLHHHLVALSLASVYRQLVEVDYQAGAVVIGDDYGAARTANTEGIFLFRQCAFHAGEVHHDTRGFLDGVTGGFRGNITECQAQLHAAARQFRKLNVVELIGLRQQNPGHHCQTQQHNP